MNKGKVLSLSVKKNGWVIQFIKNPTKNMQLDAVKQNPNSIQYIKDPHPEVELYVKMRTTL